MRAEQVVVPSMLSHSTWKHR